MTGNFWQTLPQEDDEEQRKRDFLAQASQLPSPYEGEIARLQDAKQFVAQAQQNDPFQRHQDALTFLQHAQATNPFDAPQQEQGDLSAPRSAPPVALPRPRAGATPVPQPTPGPTPLSQAMPTPMAGPQATPVPAPSFTSPPAERAPVPNTPEAQVEGEPSPPDPLKGLGEMGQGALRGYERAVQASQRGVETAAGFGPTGADLPAQIIAGIGVPASPFTVLPSVVEGATAPILGEPVGKVLGAASSVLQPGGTVGAIASGRRALAAGEGALPLAGALTAGAIGGTAGTIAQAQQGAHDWLSLGAAFLEGTNLAGLGEMGGQVANAVGRAVVGPAPEPPPDQMRQAARWVQSFVLGGTESGGIRPLTPEQTASLERLVRASGPETTARGLYDAMVDTMASATGSTAEDATTKVDRLLRNRNLDPTTITTDGRNALQRFVGYIASPQGLRADIANLVRVRDTGEPVPGEQPTGDLGRTTLPERAGPINYNPTEAARYQPGGDLERPPFSTTAPSPAATGIVAGSTLRAQQDARARAVMASDQERQLALATREYERADQRWRRNWFEEARHTPQAVSERHQFEAKYSAAVAEYHARSQASEPPLTTRDLSAVAPAERAPAIPEAHQNALDYVRQAGIADDLRSLPYLKNDVATQREIARLYHQAQSTPNDPAVRRAYDQFAHETQAQFSFLNDRGITFIPYYDAQPAGDGSDFHGYANSDSVRADIRDNHRLYVYADNLAHPLLGDTGAGGAPQDNLNWQFRAVHDYFGHGVHDNQFGPRGEENAWVDHSLMYSPLARAAMTTETRGQNSWVNFGPHRDLPLTERPFAEQKAFLLPEQYQTRPELGETRVPISADAAGASVPTTEPGTDNLPPPMPGTQGNLHQAVYLPGRQRWVEQLPGKRALSHLQILDANRTPHADRATAIRAEWTVKERLVQLYPYGNPGLLQERGALKAALEAVASRTPDDWQVSIEFGDGSYAYGYVGDGWTGLSDHRPVAGAPLVSTAVAVRPSIDVSPSVIDQATQHVLALHSANGGATFNLADGDQGGKDLYAVAYYRDRGQIIDGPLTAPILRAYVERNRDLLADPRNNIGTWDQTAIDGKTYLDISRTTPDREQAMQWAREREEKAINHLTNFEDIPVSQGAGVTASDQHGGAQPVSGETTVGSFPRLDERLQEVADQADNYTAQIDAIMQQPSSASRNRALKVLIDTRDTLLKRVRHDQQQMVVRAPKFAGPTTTELRGGTDLFGQPSRTPRSLDNPFGSDPGTQEYKHSQIVLEALRSGQEPSQEALKGIPGAVGSTTGLSGKLTSWGELKRYADLGKDAVGWYREIANDALRRAATGLDDKFHQPIYDEMLALFGRAGQQTTPEENLEVAVRLVMARMALQSRQELGKPGLWPPGERDILKGGTRILNPRWPENSVLPGIWDGAKALWVQGIEPMGKMKIPSYTGAVQGTGRGLPPNWVVPDTWIFRAMGYDNPEKGMASPAAGRFVQAHLALLGQEIGTTPLEAQAAVWTGYREEHENQTAKIFLRKQFSKRGLNPNFYPAGSAGSAQYFAGAAINKLRQALTDGEFTAYDHGVPYTAQVSDLPNTDRLRVELVKPDQKASARGKRAAVPGYAITPETAQASALYTALPRAMSAIYNRGVANHAAEEGIQTARDEGHPDIVDTDRVLTKDGDPQGNALLYSAQHHPLVQRLHQEASGIVQSIIDIARQQGIPLDNARGVYLSPTQLAYGQHLGARGGSVILNPFLPDLVAGDAEKLGIIEPGTAGDAAAAYMATNTVHEVAHQLVVGHSGANDARHQSIMQQIIDAIAPDFVALRQPLYDVLTTAHNDPTWKELVNGFEQAYERAYAREIEGERPGQSQLLSTGLARLARSYDLDKFLQGARSSGYGTQTGVGLSDYTPPAGLATRTEVRPGVRYTVRADATGDRPAVEHPADTPQEAERFRQHYQASRPEGAVRIDQEPTSAPATGEPVSGQVPLDVARALPVQPLLPTDPDILLALHNTPGVRVTPEGVLFEHTSRGQKAQQAGQPVNRGGPFYEPVKAVENHYAAEGDSWDFGGAQTVEGPTLFKRPLILNNWVSIAFGVLRGWDASDVLDGLIRDALPDGASFADRAKQFRDVGARYGINTAQTDHMLATSGSALAARTALLEAIGAQAARDAGYDGIIAIDPRTEQVGEIQDIREATYPTPEGGYSLHPSFQPISGDVTGGAPQTPKGPAPDRIDKAQTLFERYRYFNTLGGSANALNDLVSNGIQTVGTLPHTALKTGVEAALGVPMEARSATLNELRGAHAGLLTGYMRGLASAGEAMVQGHQPVREEQPRGLVKGPAGLPLEFGQRVRVAADVLVEQVGVPMAVHMLAYRQADREGLKFGTPAYEKRVNEIMGQVNYRLLGDVKQAGTASYGRATLYDELASEAKTTAKAMIFQNELGAKAKQIGGLQGGALGGLVLFYKTSARIASNNVTLTPGLGAAGALFDLAQAKRGRGPYAPEFTTTGQEIGHIAARTNDPSTDTFSGRMASQVEGLLIAGLGAGLAGAGLMTGAGPSDPEERKRWRQDGHKPYALVVGKQEYPITGPLSPIAMPLIMGAMVGDYVRNGGTLSGGALENMLADTADYWATASGLRSVGALFALAGSGTPAEKGRNLTHELASMAGTLVPESALLRQLARATDGTVRDPKTFLDTIKANLPGLSHLVAPKRDETGAPIPVPPGQTGIRAFLPFQSGENREGTDLYKYIGSKSHLQDRLIDSATQRVQDWRRDPRAYPRPTQGDLQTFNRFQGRENPRYELLRTKELARQRAVKLAS